MNAKGRMMNSRSVGDRQQAVGGQSTTNHRQSALSNRQSLIPNPSFVPRLSFLLLGLFSVAVLSGCGGDLPSRISGKVTLGDVPLHTGTVVFHPVKDGAAVYGAIDKDGNYSARTGTGQGLVPGEYVVTVVATTGPPPGSTNMRELGTLLTPARYGNPKESDLHFTIEPGANRIDIPLRSL